MTSTVKTSKSSRRVGKSIGSTISINCLISSLRLYTGCDSSKIVICNDLSFGGWSTTLSRKAFARPTQVKLWASTWTSTLLPTQKSLLQLRQSQQSFLTCDRMLMGMLTSQNPASTSREMWNVLVDYSIELAESRHPCEMDE